MGSVVVGKRHPIQKRANRLSLKIAAKKFSKVNLPELDFVEGGVDA
jgi:hypothetical protein